MGQGTLGEVQDGSVDTRGGPGWVEGPTRRSWTGRGGPGQFEDLHGGSGQVEGLSRSSGARWGTLLKVRDRSRYPPEGPG